MDLDDYKALSKSFTLFRAKATGGTLLLIFCPVKLATFGVLVWLFKHYESSIGSKGLYILALGVLGFFGTLEALFLLLWWRDSIKDIANGWELVSNLVSTCAHYTSFYLLSGRWSVRVPRYWQSAVCIPGCGTGMSRLCDQCREIVRSSPLLTGASLPVISSVEEHKHHTWGVLYRSAETCHLCHLLLHSVLPTRQNTIPDTQNQRLSDSQHNPIESTGDFLTVTIRETTEFRKHAKLSLQLGGCNLDSACISVEHGELPHRESSVSNAC